MNRSYQKLEELVSAADRVAFSGNFAEKESFWRNWK
jgi:hypothetical protein